MRSRRTLLEEELAVNPIRIADEHVGTAASAAKRALCDREVVPREVQFREPRAGKEDLSWIRDRDAASRDCQDLLLSGPFHNYGEAPRAPRRPSRKARGGRIPGVFDRRATPRGGMHRRPNATVIVKRTT